MKLGLAFSGGKDSWAALLLNRERLSEITVLWVNTGNIYPETLAEVEKARKLCPLFEEILSDQPEQNRRNGIPSDVVPVDWTLVGQSVSRPKAVMIQPYLQCCMENLSWPMHRRVKELGITHLIRGQRSEESHHSAGGHLSTFDGVTYLHPIETWTEKEVFEFLGRHYPDYPEHFRTVKHSSLDCFDCTAYRKESADRIAFTRDRHPSLYQAYAKRLDLLQTAITEALNG